MLAAVQNAVGHLLADLAAERRASTTGRLHARPAEALQLIGIPTHQ
jgi:hypothetical protein